MLKVGLTAIALIPVAGPLAVLWIVNFPPPQAESLRDDIGGYHARFTGKWLDVFRAKGPKAKYRDYRRAVDENDDDV